MGPACYRYTILFYMEEIDMDKSNKCEKGIEFTESPKGGKREKQNKKKNSKKRR